MPDVMHLWQAYYSVSSERDELITWAADTRGVLNREYYLSHADYLQDVMDTIRDVIDSATGSHAATGAMILWEFASGDRVLARAYNVRYTLVTYQSRVFGTLSTRIVGDHIANVRQWRTQAIIRVTMMARDAFTPARYRFSQ